MIFNSLTFAVFFLIVLTGYSLLQSWPSRKHWLLLASFVFYGAWNPAFALLLAATLALDWWLARRIDAAHSPQARKAWLLLSLLSNLGVLGYFKYGQFLLDNTQVLLQTVGIDYQPPDSSIVLPVGISFYTFQSMSYTIDVYRRRLKADWSLGDFALYVSFFPQLVAGPIVRADQFLPQCLAPKRASPDQMGWGLTLLAMGLFCKVVLADALLAPVADEIYGASAATDAASTWAGVLAFSGQIYYDFCGYSLCAMGAAACLGFHLPENFLRPYSATSITDFWRRWHVSLSSWLRDYLYIPLGGSRHGTTRTYVSLMLTMLIGGLWHGASWLFVLWGGLHGLYLAIERGLSGRHLPKLPDPLLAVTTFVLVSLTWIPFRAQDLDSAVRVFLSLSQLGNTAFLDSSFQLALMTMALTVLWQFRERRRSLEIWFRDLPSVGKTVVLATCLVSIYLASGNDQRSFIYFQF